MENKSNPVQISVWHADSTQLSEVEKNQLIALLSPSEQQRYHDIKLPRRRNEFLLGRAMVREQLCSRYDQQAQSWQIEPNDNGKPEVTAGSIRPNFSISHSKGIVVCTIAECGPLGIDVEYIDSKRDLNTIAAEVFNATEQQWFNQKNRSLKRRRFYQLWTLKEAWAKATGVGIGAILRGADLMQTSASLQGFSEEKSAFFCSGNSGVISNYWLCHFILSKDFVCGIALHRNNEELPPKLTIHNYVVKSLSKGIKTA